MPGTRQCILSKCQRPRADMSTIKALGFGICCALGGREGVNLTDADAGRRCPTPRHIPPRFMSLQPSDVISRFCRTLLACKVPRDPPDWFLVVRDALTSLDFVTSSLPEHLEELLDCVTKVQAVLLEEDFKALSLRTPTEVEAFKSVHCLISHLNKAVAVSGASCRLSGVVKAKIAALEEYCRITLHRLSSGFHQPWHERLQNLLINLQHFQRPRLLYVMATLLTEAEQTLQKGCFTDAELGTLTHAQNMAYDYAPLHPYVAQISELQAKHETVKRSSGSMTSVETSLPPAAQPRPIRGRQQYYDPQPEGSHEDQCDTPTEAFRSFAYQSLEQQLPQPNTEWGREPYHLQYSPENFVPQTSLCFTNSAYFLGAGESDQPNHLLHPQLPVLQSPTHRLQGSNSTSHGEELRWPQQSFEELNESHHSLKQSEQSAEPSHHLYKGPWRHASKSSAQLANTEHPSSSFLQQPIQGWVAPLYGGQYTESQDHCSTESRDVRATNVVEEQSRDFSATRSLPTLAGSQQVRQVGKGDSQKHLRQNALETTTDEPTNSVTGDMSDGTTRHNAFHQMHSPPLREPEKCFMNIEIAFEQELAEELGRAHQNVWQLPEYLNIDRSVNALLDASYKLAQTPPYRNPSSLVALNNLHSSLLRARRKIESVLSVHATVLQRRNLDQIIWNVSRAWHRLRLIDLNSDDRLLPNQSPLLPSEIHELTTYERPSFVVSQVYGALLKEDGVEEAVKKFFEYLMATSSPIDLPTAKVCLLVLLFLRHDYVDLIPQEGKESLDKLLVKLRHELLIAKVTEISLFDLPEFITLSFKCYGADEVPQRGWQASLREEGFWPREILSPLVSKLNRYGKAFRLGLEKILALPTVGMYADQIQLLKRFYSCLQAPTNLNDSEIETIFEQTSKFAEACITECKETGHPASPHQLQVLEVTRNSLQWCRLLSAYTRVTPPDVLREAYDRISTAWILKSLWSREQTLFLINTDRASITKKILSVLESDQVHDELTASPKALFDQNVPYKFVELSLMKVNQDQVRTFSDDDKMMNLLTRAYLLNAAEGGKSSRMVRLMRRSFQTAVIQARLTLLGYPNLPVPDKPLYANLAKRFASPSAATQLLCVDTVLEDALKGLKLEDLSLSEVARHVANYLLGESPDEQWAAFMTQDISWCSYTAQQLMSSELQGDLLMLSEILRTPLKATLQFSEGALNREAAPYLLRHFVNLATLRWLSDSTVALRTNANRGQQALSFVLGEHAVVWIPRWLVLMHSQQALFPPDVTVPSELFEALCESVTCRTNEITRPAEESPAVLTSYELHCHLRYMLRGLSAGTLTRQDIEVLATKAHEERFTSKASTNTFLAFLLWAWHHKCLHAAQSNLVKNCIKTVMHEISHHEEDGVSSTTVQRCLQELISIWDA
eukprot:Blabericola_migrator_1__13423@NODE_961_length_5893_cov_16_783728_g667_i0_p1_GENE_NODE_961_length_5893_cov_16_783728_g667_i0NODE_961_length_5893_cov_16_783728_g667_i0_p1_ORF_typecomplete_len1409_score230_43_NODE_961_length_5893_cov_16_783728_g667_i015785804